MKETWKKVENKSEFGSFHAMITEDGKVSEYEVPAVYFGQFLEFEEEYIALKLLEGNPLVAYRTGDRGACAVITNPDLLEVQELKRYYPVRSLLGREVERQVDEDPTGRHFIGGHGERIEVLAKTLAGLPFSATISFVPSPQ